MENYDLDDQYFSIWLLIGGFFYLLEQHRLKCLVNQCPNYTRGWGDQNFSQMS